MLVGILRDVRVTLACVGLHGVHIFNFFPILRQLRPPKMDRAMYHQRKKHQKLMETKRRLQHKKPPYEPDKVAIKRAKRIPGPTARS